MIRCEALSKQFGDDLIVDRLDLEVQAGEFLVLVGASGSGKTTTLKMLNRLIEPSGGAVLLDGEDVRQLDPVQLRRRIGYGAQRAGLFPHFDVARNVGVTGRLLGWDRDEERARVNALLEEVGLDPDAYAHRDPRSLSGGEQQRVSLARALCARPKLILLDEPFGALDPVSRDELQQALLGIVSDLGLTVVFVTHDMSEALLLADRIAVLEGGRIAQLGAPAALLNQPATAGVEAFLRAPQRHAAQLGLLGAPGTAPGRPGDRSSS